MLERLSDNTATYTVQVFSAVTGVLLGTGTRSPGSGVVTVTFTGLPSGVRGGTDDVQ